MKSSWKIEPDAKGVRISCVRVGLLGSRKIVPFSDWSSIAEARPGVGLLQFLVKAGDVSVCGDGVLAPHLIVANLEESQATSVGLPPAIPYALQLGSNGTIDESGFSLSVRWLKFANTPVNLSTEGAIASEGQSRYRIPGGLFRLIQAIEEYELADTGAREARVKHWQSIQESLSLLTGETARPDGYLQDLRIFHAASLSLKTELSKDEGITFDPVLFGRTVLQKHRRDLFGSDPLADPAFDDEDAGLDDSVSVDGVDTLVDEADSLLPDDLQQIFLKRRQSDRADKCREAYPLKRNTFVYLDEPLRNALDVVKIMQSASAAERRKFIKNPRQAFAGAMETEADSNLIHGLFIETRQYAEWVNGIGLWEPKVLPWLPKSSTSWLPEKIGFTIDGNNIEIQPERLSELRAACEAAIIGKKDSFDFDSMRGLPARPETLAAIDTLEDMAARMTAAREKEAENDESENGESDLKKITYAVEVDDNLEELRLELGLIPREAEIPKQNPPGELIDPRKLFPHQREGFDWLVKTWLMGRPGVLLADDMGLGKTIQTLAFAAWLHANDMKQTGGKRGPILIVAPTTLLKNWQEEHDRHLSNGGIGPVIELYGGGIRAYKQEPAAARDTIEGHGVLDREKLREASCILTTYETLANYHISLAGIHYPLVVFDEMQKLKTPTTINTHAAKTLNIDFTIGLTGTPVENKLSELWSIMDRLHPGLMKDLRTFTQTYRDDDSGSLQLLRDELRNGEVAGAAVMLRRMKDKTDIGKALPERRFFKLIRDMPENQARAYQEVVSTARIEQTTKPTPATMLKALQRMRGISLHPEHPSIYLGRTEAYNTCIAQSARLNAAIETLDEIRERGDKALVFIEYREMQRLFADILRHRYHLPNLPSIINGQVPSVRRQDLVSQFQTGPAGEFDVMILAPRAAGVGLNITAASQVIHLSRWWNPAVEDQCNDRAYRIGQRKPVSVYLPIARHPVFGDGSFDMKLEELLSRKRQLSRDLLVPMESDSDYREMFRSTVLP